MNVPHSADAVEEVPWWLEVNGERAAIGTVLPASLDAFFAGRLATDGVIARREDLLSLDITRAPPGLLAARALVPLARARNAAEERRHRAAQGCGPLHLATCVAQPHRPIAIEPPEPRRFAALFRTLFDEADRRYGGGVHAAALSDGQMLRHQHEDVGRHNAVDKTIGAAVLAGEEIAQSGLVLTARVSGEIAAKAARCGIRWIASRSVPTTLALRIADACGIAIIARAAGRHVTIHVPESDE